MKVHSLKLTIQDVPDNKGKLFAGVFGTVTLDTGEPVIDEKTGEPKLDAEGNVINLLEDIQTATALNANPVFKGEIQAFLIEAITLKNLKIAEENGQVSHFLEAVGAVGEKKKGRNITKAKIKRKK